MSIFPYITFLGRWEQNWRIILMWLMWILEKNVFTDFVCVCVQWYLVNHRLLGPFIQSLPMILPVKATWSYHDPSWSIQLTWYVWDKSCHLKIAYRTHFHSFSSWLALIFGDWLPACSSYPMGPSLQQARSPRFFAAPGNKKTAGRMAYVNLGRSSVSDQP